MYRSRDHNVINNNWLLADLHIPKLNLPIKEVRSEAFPICVFYCFYKNLGEGYTIDVLFDFVTIYRNLLVRNFNKMISNLYYESEIALVRGVRA